MEELLSSPLVRIGSGIVVILVVAKLVVRLLSRPKLGAMQLRVRCSACGWTGVVGKYAKKCSRCGGTSLDSVRG